MAAPTQAFLARWRPQRRRSGLIATRPREPPDVGRQRDPLARGHRAGTNTDRLAWASRSRSISRAGAQHRKGGDQHRPHRRAHEGCSPVLLRRWPLWPSVHVRGHLATPAQTELDVTGARGHKQNAVAYPPVTTGRDPPHPSQWRQSRNWPLGQDPSLLGLIPTGRDGQSAMTAWMMSTRAARREGLMAATMASAAINASWPAGMSRVVMPWRRRASGGDPRPALDGELDRERGRCRCPLDSGSSWCRT